MRIRAATDQIFSNSRKDYDQPKVTITKSSHFRLFSMQGKIAAPGMADPRWAMGYEPGCGLWAVGCGP